MSGRGTAACRSTHAKPATATRQRRDGSPYAQTQAGLSLGEEPGTRRRLLLEVPPR